MRGYEDALGIHFFSSVENENFEELRNQIDSVRYPNDAIPTLNAKAEALIGWYEQTQDLEKLRSAYDSYFLSTQLIDRLRKGFRSAGSKLLLSEDAIHT